MTQCDLPLYGVEELAPEEVAQWLALLLAEPLKVGPNMYETDLVSTVLPLPAKDCGHF